MDIIDPEERMKDLLFRNKNYKETSKVIRDLWVLRRQLLKEREKGKETATENQREMKNQNPPQNGLPQSRIIESPEGDTPIVNPPQCGLPLCRIIELTSWDTPIVHPSQHGEKNPPQSGLPQCRVGNPPQSGPPQCGLLLGRKRNPPQNVLPLCRTGNPPQCGPPQCGLPQGRTI